MQARNLVWRDLSAEQLGSIRHPHPKKGLTGRDLLVKYLAIGDPSSPRNAITLDLYVHTLQFGQVRARMASCEVALRVCMARHCMESRLDA